MDVQCQLGRETHNSGDQGKIESLPETTRIVEESTKQTNQMEKCMVCNRSFKTRRGLRAHQARTWCKQILEINRKCKSKEGSPQESHHSGSTKETIPEMLASNKEASDRDQETSSSASIRTDANECVEPYNVHASNPETILKDDKKKTVQQESVLVVDDDVERKIKESVLAGIRADVGGRKKKSAKFRKLKKEGPKSMDIRCFTVVTKEPQAPEDERSILINEVQQNIDIPCQQRGVKTLSPIELEHPRREVIIVQQQDQDVLPVHHEEYQRTRASDFFKQEQSPERIVVNSSAKNTIYISDGDIAQDTRRVEENKPNEPIYISGEENSTPRKVVTSKDKNKDIRRYLSLGPGTSMNETDNYKNIIKNLNTGPPDDILSRNGLHLRRRDYRSLSGRNYLNDQIMNEYFTLIRWRNASDKLSSIFTLSTHYFTKLDINFDDGYIDVVKWIKEDLTDKDTILVPIHQVDHWSLVAVEMSEKRVLYYDSIRGRQHRSSAPRVLKKFMERYFEEKGKPTLFTTKVVENAPLQGNGYDCGVFVCQNAEKIARKAPVTTRQEDMTDSRMKMMQELFLGRLIKSNLLSLQEFAAESNPKKPNPKKPSTKGEKPSRSGTIASAVHKPKAQQVKSNKINWPKSNSSEWDRLDVDLTGLLRLMYSTPEKKAISHPKIIFEMSKERFGFKDKKAFKTAQRGPSRRQKKCKELREEINILKRTFSEALPEQREAVQELQTEKLKQLRLAKRAESLKQNRKKFASNCHKFLSQPFQFSREVLSPKPKGNLESSKEAVEKHLKAAHSQPTSNQERGSLATLLDFDSPETDFDDRPPTYKEFVAKLRKTRSKSSPGPNGVPYLIYKRCPGVAGQLWGYLKELWRRNKMSETWREAEGVFIPKEEGATTVDKFRTISLLNVEGKLFFSLKADRITDFLICNKNINPSIQKGGVPGVSGCLEHTAILSQLIREAKQEKKNLVVTWLDIANAYGSIPHDVIKTALERAHVPEKTRELISSYYSDVRIRFTTSNFTTDWQRVERGIITGCTLSVVLFSLTMSWLVESVKKETKGPKTSSGQRQVNSRLFMDDITTTTETVPQTKYLLEKLAEKLNWAGLKVKPGKCRSLVIVKGVLKPWELKINGDAITSIQDIHASEHVVFPK